jgi:ABC-type long-subunit fatty acid transport system fused permease/ATPase subunit
MQLGFTMEFLLFKKFAFRSGGYFMTESIQYLIAFLFNLLVLCITITNLGIHSVLSRPLVIRRLCISLLGCLRFNIMICINNNKLGIQS